MIKTTSECPWIRKMRAAQLSTLPECSSFSRSDSRLPSVAEHFHKQVRCCYPFVADLNVPCSWYQVGGGGTSLTEPSGCLSRKHYGISQQLLLVLLHQALEAIMVSIPPLCSLQMEKHSGNFSDAVTRLNAKNHEKRTSFSEPQMMQARLIKPSHSSVLLIILSKVISIYYPNFDLLNYLLPDYTHGRILARRTIPWVVSERHRLSKPAAPSLVGCYMNLQNKVPQESVSGPSLVIWHALRFGDVRGQRCFICLGN